MPKTAALRVLKRGTLVIRWAEGEVLRKFIFERLQRRGRRPL
jgi:hypothetical protein